MTCVSPSTKERWERFSRRHVKSQVVLVATTTHNGQSDGSNSESISLRFLVQGSRWLACTFEGSYPVVKATIAVTLLATNRTKAQQTRK